MSDRITSETLRQLAMSDGWTSDTLKAFLVRLGGQMDADAAKLAVAETAAAEWRDKLAEAKVGWQTASARVVDLEGQLHAMAERVSNCRDLVNQKHQRAEAITFYAEQAEARLADYKTAHHQPESEGENDSMLAGYQRALDDVESLKARLAEVERELDRLNSVVLPHARSQENANGFQRGWHAALDRMSGGEAVEVLSRLVPEPAATVEVPVCTACERCSTLSAALEAIHTTVRGDEKSECWTIRKWLDERGIFNDDLSGGQRLVEEVCKAVLSAALARAEVPAKE